jgi:hypothetical protein
MTVLASGSRGAGIGYIVILLLIVATVVLIRSMSKRLGNVKRNAANWPVDDPRPTDVARDDEPPVSPSA